MQRLVDLQCEFCATKAEDLIEKPHGEPLPKRVAAVCGTCFNVTPHVRLLSAPAPYMGERNLSPIVYGGTYDTMGARQGPDLPELPGHASHMDMVADRLAKLGPEASHNDRAAVLADTVKTAPSSADLSAHMQSSEYQETLAARKSIQHENKAKKARAAAFLRGESVNFRRDRVAGDPNMAA